MKSPQEVAIELIENEHRQWRFQKATERRQKNKDARSRGYKNHGEYVGDEPGEDTRRADSFDHARDLRKH